jgi:hypothetical protein
MFFFIPDIGVWCFLSLFLNFTGILKINFPLLSPLLFSSSYFPLKFLLAFQKFYFNMYRCGFLCNYFAWDMYSFVNLEVKVKINEIVTYQIEKISEARVDYFVSALLIKVVSSSFLSSL